MMLQLRCGMAISGLRTKNHVMEQSSLSWVMEDSSDNVYNAAVYTGKEEYGKPALSVSGSCG